MKNNDLYELHDLLEEYKRRQKLKKDSFTPHPEQREVILDPALEKYVFSGNGWGKSQWLAYEIKASATGIDNVAGKQRQVPSKIALMLDSPEKIDHIIKAYQNYWELKPEWCSKRGKANISYIEWPNGSQLYVFSHEMGDLKVEGEEWTDILFDEPPPRDKFIGLTRGGREIGKPARVRLAGTPIAQAWLRRDIFKPWAAGELEDVMCFRGSTDANAKNLDPRWFKNFFSKLTEQEIKVRRHGDFFDLEGQALAHLLDRRIHLVEDFEWDKSWPCVIAIDPHPSKKHHTLLIGVDRHNQQFVIDKYAAKEVPRVFARRLKDWLGYYRVVDIVVDNLGSADMTGGEGFKSFIQVLNEEGVRARPTSFKEKEDEAFIERLREALYIPDTPNNFGQRVPKLRFMSRTQQVYQECEEAGWQRDKANNTNKDKLDIQNLDYLACLKYGLAANLFYGKHKAKAYSRVGDAYGFEGRNQRAKRRRAANMLKNYKRRA